MIDDKTKNKFLQDLEKSGNVYLSCMRVGINRATYYRWKNGDKEFRKKAILAERNGRQNNCDVAEHALMMNVKDRKIDAIKYLLSHNSSRYKPKNRKVYIEHSNLFKEEELRIKRDADERLDKQVNGLNNLMQKIMDKNDGTFIDTTES